MSKSRRTQLAKGQGLVEFSISILVLMVLLVGVIDLGRALFTFITLRDAAQEGALYGSIMPADLTGIESRVRNSANAPVDLRDTSRVDVLIGFSGAQCSGSAIQVEVIYPNFDLSTPLLGAILGSQSIPIRASVTNTILRPECEP
jgi:hypothetical protein